MRKFGPDPLTILERILEKCRTRKNCIEWTGCRRHNGRPVMTVSGQKQKLVYRLVYELAFGEKIKNGLFVCHTCDNPVCIRPSHLFLGTAKDNALDMMKKGRGNPIKGSAHHAAKLTESKIKQIRMMIDKRIVQHKIAKRFSVTPQTVTLIKQRKVWAHV
jgi:hypothetical protein